MLIDTTIGLLTAVTWRCWTSRLVSRTHAFASERPKCELTSNCETLARNGLEWLTVAIERSMLPTGGCASAASGRNGLCVELLIEGNDDFLYCGEGRTARRLEGFVGAVAGDARLSCKLCHASSPCNIAKNSGDKIGVAVLESGIKVGDDVGVTL